MKKIIIVGTGISGLSIAKMLDENYNVIEFSGKHEQSSMIKELDKFPGNIKPLAFNYEPNSYIIQNEDTRVIIQEIKELLKPYNIYLLGRFAEWEYFNMDKCIDSAMKIVNENFGS